MSNVAKRTLGISKKVYENRIYNKKNYSAIRNYIEKYVEDFEWEEGDRYFKTKFYDLTITCSFYMQIKIFREDVVVFHTYNKSLYEKVKRL